MAIEYQHFLSYNLFPSLYLPQIYQPMIGNPLTNLASCFLCVYVSMNVGNTLKKLPAKLTLTEDSRVLTTTAAAPSPSPSPSPSSGPPSARSTRASKWGRLLGSSSVDSASDTSAKVAVSRSLSARESLRESTAAQARQSSTSSSNGGQGNKVIDQKISTNSKEKNKHFSQFISLH